MLPHDLGLALAMLCGCLVAAGSWRPHRVVRVTRPFHHHDQFRREVGAVCEQYLEAEIFANLAAAA